MAKKQKSLARRRESLAPGRRVPLWTWFVAGAALAVVLVVGLLYLGQTNTLASDIEGVVILPDPGRGHQDGDISYPQAAPVGGIHNPTWQNCGIYDEPVQAENVIHSMEHGAVWLAYQPDLPAGQVDILRNLVRQEQSRLGERMVVLAPQPGLDVPIVATAWRVQLELEDAADERLPRFLASYQRGPFYPEPGATCIGGMGEPLS